MSDLHIDIKTDRGTLTVRSEGLFFGSVRVFPLRKAESVLAETLRAIQTVLEVEDPHRPQTPYAAPTCGSAPVGATVTGAEVPGISGGGEESGVSDPFAQALSPSAANCCPCSEYRHGVPCRRCR